MPELIWTPAALRDVQHCYRFLAPKSPTAASRAVTMIREGMRIIKAHPETGRLAVKMDPKFREWLIGVGDSG
ncbi:type II toxin-antitoxin system RelE/ParE family toxin [Paracoccus lutimaris]|uniref:ParE-like toxin of type II ParDE toxin-antitoxin system n=1 Tax=Paracoccus lutimaris TaxID=1490030 RepID=A0A368YBZ6_9RHOB|nr:type II toxin-antitoxin system RelE/ParE family toxin [Paracoccus lutimaris]RCW77722.1 ParE-like toxin of type II ParDE toxin-antitoxin system [Paracoccus lutimaris]